jgi:hypothetical protein
VESPEGWGPSREGARPQVGRSDSRGVLTGCRLQCLSVPAAWAALVPGRGRGTVQQVRGRAELSGPEPEPALAPGVCACVRVYMRAWERAPYIWLRCGEPHLVFQYMCI